MSQMTLDELRHHLPKPHLNRRWGARMHLTFIAREQLQPARVAASEVEPTVVT